MIDTERFVTMLQEHNINFYTGIPDSVLKEFCLYLFEHMSDFEHMVPANEGNAVALASGHYLSTGEIPLCYMQNSGLGNAINPILSLTDETVYHIPILYMIGYRGKKEQKDEPQHRKQGLITEDILKVLGIEYMIVNKKTPFEYLQTKLSKIIQRMKKEKFSYAILIERDSFEQRNQYNFPSHENIEMTEEEAISGIIDYIGDDITVSSTGFISRQLFELRERRKESHKSDFLNIGAMGHSSMVALGIAKNLYKKRVFILDGDGALIMHMGTLAIIGASELKNVVHIVLNNSSHNSVGGFPTKGFDIDLVGIAQASGYTESFLVTQKKELEMVMKNCKNRNGKIFIEVRINKQVRKNLLRPDIEMQELASMFMNYLKEEK